MKFPIFFWTAVFFLGVIHSSLWEIYEKTSSLISICDLLNSLKTISSLAIMDWKSKLSSFGSNSFCYSNSAKRLLIFLDDESLRWFLSKDISFLETDLEDIATEDSSSRSSSLIFFFFFLLFKGLILLIFSLIFYLVCNW